jgi:starch phosphorylase
VLERVAAFMKANNVSFNEALAVTRAGNIFTIHSAVPASFDKFSIELMEKYFSDYVKHELNISFNDFMALGRQHPNNMSETFNMAYLAIRGCGAVNGVSNLHRSVSRHLFQPLFERYPNDEVPVDYVTNGVHMPSWDSQFADKLWTEACGKDRWKGALEMLEENIYKVSDDALWQMRCASRNNLVNYVRKRFERQVSICGQQEMTDIAKNVFGPNVLTLGFARRFVPYKRPTLLLHDEERLIRILTNNEKPVQLVIAGKAPPYDETGKVLIQKWIQFISKNNLYKHVIFLSDYDMLMTENIVQGIDVWINTPRRPWEACGTSGMKVLVNGGVNLSELDGWWAEAYTPEVGWAIGDMHEHHDDPAWDAAEADTLYTLLEQQIVPAFYQRDTRNIPLSWIEKMRKSMAQLTPQYSANRTVREYTEKYYLPAAEKYLQRAANNVAVGKKIINAKHQLENNWNGIHFNNVQWEKIDGGFSCAANIIAHGVDANNVLVELYAEVTSADNAERITMQLQSSNNDEKTYKAMIQTARPVNDYTIRIIPNYENISVPLENNLIVWQR